MGRIDRDEIKRIAEQIRAENPEKRVAYERHLAASKPILDELARLGYDIESLDDLRHQGKPWKTAVPILVRWLPEVSDTEVKENIVRALSVPWVGDEATAELIEEFKKYAPIVPQQHEDLSDFSSGQLIKRLQTAENRNPSSSLAWTIGNALSIVDVKGFERQIIDLCRNTRYGTARQMLVLGLSRLRNSEAEEAALELLDDDDVKLHAIGALGKMKAKKALLQLERVLTDKRAAIRKEARKAITKIMR